MTVKGDWFSGEGVERKEGEDIVDLLERRNKRRAEYRPWEAPKPIEPPKEQPRMPYVDREPGSDDE
jgi:hypothetical protein